MTQKNNQIAAESAITPKKLTRNGRVVTRSHLVWYFFCRFWVQLFMLVVYRLRAFGVENTKFKGAALIISNHQSFLDPPAVGVPVPEKLNFLARKTLFKFKPFGKLIDSVDAIPLDQEGLGYEGVKETIRRLKNGEKVVIFPEGARTENGEITPFKKGVTALAVRAKAAIIPAAIAGTFESWPRQKIFPNFFPDHNGIIRVIYGEPIFCEQSSAMSDDELHNYVEKKVRELYESIRIPKT